MGKKSQNRWHKLFLKKEDSPGLIISSPAFRALETALIFAGEAGSDYDKIVLSSDLYFNTNLLKLLKTISAVSDDVKTITLFGHNPSFSDMS